MVTAEAAVAADPVVAEGAVVAVGTALVLLVLVTIDPAAVTVELDGPSMTAKAVVKVPVVARLRANAATRDLRAG